MPSGESISLDVLVLIWISVRQNAMDKYGIWSAALGDNTVLFYKIFILLFCLFCPHLTTPCPWHLEFGENVFPEFMKLEVKISKSTCGFITEELFILRLQMFFSCKQGVKLHRKFGSEFGGCSLIGFHFMCTLT